MTSQMHWHLELLKHGGQPEPVRAHAREAER